VLAGDIDGRRSAEEITVETYLHVREDACERHERFNLVLAQTSWERTYAEMRALVLRHVDRAPVDQPPSIGPNRTAERSGALGSVSPAAAD